MSRTEAFDNLVSEGFPKEWILRNWDSVESLSKSAVDLDEFLVLIGDWFAIDEADGLI